MKRSIFEPEYFQRTNNFHMSNYTILAEDLLQTTPEDVDVTSIPYDFLQSNEIQLVSTYQKLQKAL